jgi:hypothetical protein
MIEGTLMVAGALIAFGYGIWLGLPGRFTQSAKDIEETMAAGGARRRKTKRVFTPIAWLQRKAGARDSIDRRRKGPGFKMKAPDDR